MIRNLILCVLATLTFAIYAEDWQTLAFKAPIRDQCQTSTCWLQGTYTLMDIFATAYFKEPVTFRIDYTLMHEMRSRAYASFLGYPAPLYSGGTFARALALISVYGLVPESAWTPKNSLVKKQQVMIGQLNELLTKYAGQARDQGARLRFLAEMDSLFAEFLGPIPRRVHLGGMDLSPVQAANHLISLPFFDENTTHPSFTWVNSRPASDSRGSQFIVDARGDLAKVKDIVQISRHSVNAEDALKQIVNTLEVTGLPVPLKMAVLNGQGQVVYKDGPEWKAYFHSAMPVQAEYSKSHFLIAVGFKRDHNGGIDGLLVQDSSGVRSGNEGYRILTHEFFVDHVLGFQDFKPRARVCQALLTNT